MALVELLQRSNQDDGSPVPLSDIAGASNISLSYLEQLFAGLRRNGLVRSYRGPGGGYVLAKPANDILISDILSSAEDSVPAKRTTQSKQQDIMSNPQTKALWSHIGHILHACLQQVSLADVANDQLDGHPFTNKLFESAS